MSLSSARLRLTPRDTRTEPPSATIASSDKHFSRAISSSLLRDAPTLSIHLPNLIRVDSDVASHTPSSAISTMSSMSGNHPPTLTPITNNESSPPDRMPSPLSRKRSFEQMQSDGIRSPLRVHPNGGLTPTQTPPEMDRLHARPGPGEIKGMKATFDPNINPSADGKDKRKYKVAYTSFGDKHDPSSMDPRLLIPDYPISYFASRTNHCKSRLRAMPYKLKEPAWDSKTSVGRGPSLKVVIHGYDPLTVTESKIRIVMSQYGEVAEIKSITDPRTGSYLGVCSVLFRDRSSREGRAISAADAARKAEKDGNGQRIDQSVVKIERDPEGTRAKRYAEHIATKRRLVLEKQLESEKKSAPYPTPTPSSIAVADATAGAPPVISTPPPNAPRGPSNRIVVAPPPRGPGQFIKRPTAHSLLEEEPIVDTLKRKPFIFIAHCYVPALGTTIEHLKKRMKPYKWETVRVDRTGYYIVFEDSKTGKREAIACFEGCHLQPLFNYTMNMECQLDGNPNYKDASKLAAAKALKDERKQIKIEDEADFELEKRERAENLDLSKAALERLVPEVRDKVIIDVQQKLIRAVLLNFLSPENHIERRKKNNIAEPAAAPVQPSNIVFGRNDTTPAVSNARVGYSGGYNRKFVTKIDRSRKQQEDRLPTIDDRRRLKRRQRTTDLHRRLAGFAEDDSDDERHTSITRGSDGIDSRAISEAARSPARFDVDDTGHLTPHSKRRRLASGVDSDDESINLDVRKSLGDLVDKDVVDMDLRELEQILSTAPRTTRLWKTAATEQKLRENIQENDKLFSNLSKHERQNDLVNGIKSEDASVATTPEPIELTKAAKKKMATKTKRKTKKQLQEERDMLLLAGEEVQVDEIRPEPGSTPQIIEEDMEQAGPEVEWGVSTTIPKRTVEDDRSLTHDFAGWQYTIKGEANDTISEDIVYIRLALQNTPAISLGADPDYWAWKENQIKALNNADLMQPPQDTITMSEYYVPNATGCARTEPYAKIKESEKSKYLPHRIKVKELREKRQADASRAPNAIPEATAKALVANKMSHVTSRTNRAEIRRQQTQMARLTNDLESDSIVSKFNQLKKRKKFVRFDRSSIHGWGLYAEENIVGGDMIIEYVGEKIRLRVSECREVIYQKQGIGSSYLFRLDDEDVVDATKKGGIARFINHSCMPNCTAKIITVERTKRIVIYALRDITKDEELTYDYKFEREMNSDDRIPCLCGTVACKGFLN